jgi:aspartyl-tRNA(Asn)/glutamyl-tRNA(Gln) amidotransferase subunit B
MGPLLGWLNAEGKSMDAPPVPAAGLAAMLKLMDEGAINARGAKTVFEEMVRSGKSAADIIREQGLAQVSDTDAIREAVARILARCPDEVQAYKGGKTKLMGFFVGQVMRETQGKANPNVVNQLVEEMLRT